MTQVSSSPGVPAEVVADAASVLAEVKAVIAKVETAAPAVVADVKLDASKAAGIVSAASADVAKAVSSYDFVKANWGKVSIVVVGAASIGALIGHIL